MRPQAGAAAQAIAVGGRQRDDVAAGAQRAAVEIAEPRGIGPCCGQVAVEVAVPGQAQLLGSVLSVADGGGKLISSPRL